MSVEYLSLAQTAARLGVHYNTVRAMVERGDLEAVRSLKVVRVVVRDGVIGRRP